MPREIVHWLVASRALQSSELHPTLAQTLALYSAELFIGAIAHDAPYYYRRGLDEFESVAEELHGTNGEDTFALFRRLLPMVPRNTHGQRAMAFFAGMLSHIATDAVFHPFVYYYSGDYYHPQKKQRSLARARHRLLEVYLDEHFAKQWSGERKIQNYLERCDLDVALRLLEHAHGEKWKKALTSIARYQSLFLSAPTGMLMRILNTVSFGKLRQFDYLFRFLRGGEKRAFLGKIGYQNPVTGEHASMSPEEMLERAVECTVQLFRSLECFVDDVIRDGEFFPETGPSLNCGVPNTTLKDFTFFAPTGLPLKGLRL